MEIIKTVGAIGDIIIGLGVCFYITIDREKVPTF